MTMKPALRRLFLYVCGTAAILTGACDSPSEPTSPIGFYALVSVDDDPIPAAVVEETGYSLRRVAGTFDVAADFTFIAAITTLEVVDVNQSEFVDSLRGTWALDEMGAMEFSVTGLPESANFPGSWQGRNLTVLIDDGLTLSSYRFQRAR